jgi:hypothetical protein
MTKNRMHCLIIVAGLISATVASAEFDGSKALLCSFGQVTECDAGEACRAVSHESVDAPDFVQVDFRRNQLVSITAGESSGAGEISVSNLGNFLIVQGTQGGTRNDSLGFSLSIDQATGQMVAAGAGENAGFVIFGACTVN